MMKIRTILAAALALAISLSFADGVMAKDKGGKAKDNKVQIDKKSRKGPKKVPPGQIKRYTRGAKLPTDLSYEDIGDLSKWKLKPLGKGNRYIRVDDEILEVTDDLSAVVDTVGLVGNLLK